MLKVGSRLHQPSSRIKNAPASQQSTSFDFLDLKEFWSCEFYWATHKLAFFKVCSSQLGEQEILSKSPYYWKTAMSTWVVKRKEKHLVYVLRKVKLIFIKKEMNMWQNGNDISFRMFLVIFAWTKKKTSELRPSLRISDVAMHILAWKSHELRGCVCLYSISKIKHRQINEIK